MKSAGSGRLVLFEPWSLGDVVITASALRELTTPATIACHSVWHPLPAVRARKHEDRFDRGGFTLHHPKACQCFRRQQRSGRSDVSRRLRGSQHPWRLSRPKSGTATFPKGPHSHEWLGPVFRTQKRVGKSSVRDRCFAGEKSLPIVGDPCRDCLRANGSDLSPAARPTRRPLIAS